MWSLVSNVRLTQQNGHCMDSFKWFFNYKKQKVFWRLFFQNKYNNLTITTNNFRKTIRREEGWVLFESVIDMWVIVVIKCLVNATYPHWIACKRNDLREWTTHIRVSVNKYYFNINLSFNILQYNKNSTLWLPREPIKVFKAENFRYVLYK